MLGVASGGFAANETRRAAPLYIARVPPGASRPLPLRTPELPDGEHLACSLLTALTASRPRMQQDYVDRRPSHKELWNDINPTRGGQLNALAVWLDSLLPNSDTRVGGAIARH